MNLYFNPPHLCSIENTGQLTYRKTNKQKQDSHSCWYHSSLQLTQCKHQAVVKLFQEFLSYPICYTAWFNRYPDEQKRQSLFTSMAFLHVCHTYSVYFHIVI